MRSWKKIVVIWLLAFTLPVQTFASALGHCGAANANPHESTAGSSPAGSPPCAHHARDQGGAPVPSLDDHASHAGACAACCAVPSAAAGLVAAAVSSATSFPHVIDRNPQFVPSGLKRPPSAV